VQNTARRPKITVSADGRGLVSQAGTLLLAEAARVTGLGQGLTDGLARWRAPRAVHDPGKILTDLVTALALGGDCLADIAVLRAQQAAGGKRVVRSLRGLDGGASQLQPWFGAAQGQLC
jgi:Transposase DDE domain group 1